MDFFGMGFGEVLVILIIALLIFGPGKVVGIGKTLGKTVRDFKKATSEMSNQVTRELDIEQANKPAATPSSANSSATATNTIAKADAVIPPPAAHDATSIVPKP